MGNSEKPKFQQVLFFEGCDGSRMQNLGRGGRGKTPNFGSTFSLFEIYQSLQIFIANQTSSRLV